MLRERVWLALALCAGITRAEGPFSIQLSDLSRAWFAGGAVIRIPPDKCATLQVRLEKPWSEWVGVDQVDLELDGKYPRFNRATGGEGHVLTVRTREPLGLLTRAEHQVKASCSGRNPAGRVDASALGQVIHRSHRSGAPRSSGGDPG
jgi:hypothetical protein